MGRTQRLLVVLVFCAFFISSSLLFKRDLLFQHTGRRQERQTSNTSAQGPPAVPAGQNSRCYVYFAELTSTL